MIQILEEIFLAICLTPFGLNFVFLDMHGRVLEKVIGKTIGIEGILLKGKICSGS